MARVVLDIFLSSTSDLRDYRTAIVDVLERFHQGVLRMESFGAKPTAPLPACREQVAQSDMLIVLVGNRYGWVPSPAEGGDSVKSITWWEVQWALEAGKPVYAFLLDSQAPSAGAREQDALVTAATEAKAMAIWRAVRSLQDFRNFLEQKTTRSLFGSPDQLAARVATSLVKAVVDHEVRQARAAVADAPLPSPPQSQIDAPVAPIAFDKDRQQAIVVGSDIVSFVKGVPEEQRGIIVNALLLAQLVANSKVGELRELSQVQAWHEQYSDVLENLGFVVERRWFEDHVEAASDVELLDAVRRVATAQLGPSSKALAVLLNSVEALTSLSADSPAIGLFDRESRSATIVQFQVTLVEQVDGGKVRVQLLGFGLKAAKAVTQVLFFRFQKNQANLHYFGADATIKATLLEALREPIAAKVANHKGYVQAFDVEL